MTSRATQETRYSKNIAELNSFINCLPFYHLFVYHKISCQECYSYYCNGCHCSQSGIESNLVHLETAILSQVPVSISFEATRANYKTFFNFQKKISVHMCYLEDAFIQTKSILMLGTDIQSLSAQPRSLTTTI